MKNMKKIVMGMLIGIAFVLGVYATGSPFTATVTRGFNDDGASWGNASPGTAGIDFPNAASVFHIPSGDSIIWRTSLGELGTSDISGAFIFDTTATNTFVTLEMGNATLWIKNGGHLIIGHPTMGMIKNGRKAGIIFNTTGDATNGIRIGIGGKLTTFGDSVYYGGKNKDTTSLANNPENTDGDTDIVTNSDMSSLWHVQDCIYINVEHIPTATTANNTSTAMRIIKAFKSEDTITLTTALAAPSTGVGNTWKSIVFNPMRNVFFKKLNADTALGDGSAHQNTNRPIIWDSNSVVGNGNVNLNHTLVTGFYGVRFTTSMTLNDVCIRNGYYGAYGISAASTYLNYNGGMIFGMTSGIYYAYLSTLNNIWIGACSNGECVISTGIVTTNVFGNSYGHVGVSYSSILGGTVFGNYTGLYQCFASVFKNGHSYSNYMGAQGADITYQNVVFGKTYWDAIDSNGFDFNVHPPYSTSKSYLLNCLTPRFGLRFLNINTSGARMTICSENDSQVIGQNRIYEAFGTVTFPFCNGVGSAPSIDPDGGNARCLLMTPFSACDSNDYVFAWDERPIDAVRVYATANVSKTYTFKVQTTYTALSAGLLELSAQYLDSTATGREAEVRSTNAVTVRATAADWTQTIAVTVNPLQTGWVTLRIKLKRYESGKVVCIWTKFIIS
jgi:hypothetical protein